MWYTPRAARCAFRAGPGTPEAVRMELVPVQGETTMTSGKAGAGAGTLRSADRGAPVRAIGGIPAAGVSADAENPRAVLGRSGSVLGQGGAGAALVPALAEGAGVEPAERQVVRRRADQRLLQLRGPPHQGRAAQQGRADLGGRAGRQPRADLLGPVPRGQPVRQRPEVARRRQGRPRGHLPADDPRGGDRHAGLRPDRRDPRRWSSAGSAPRRSATASTTPRPKC